MTIAEMMSSDRETLTCKDVAPVIRCNHWALHEQALYDPDTLGFPVIVVGKNVKIPRRAFLRYLGVTY